MTIIQYTDTQQTLHVSVHYKKENSGYMLQLFNSIAQLRINHKSTMNAMFTSLVLLVLCTTYVYSQQGTVRVINGCNEPLLIRNEAGSWTTKRLGARQSATVTFPYETPKPRVWALRGCTGTDERTCIDFYRNDVQFYSLAEFNWKNGQLWYVLQLFFY